MIISQRAWDQYIAALRKINDAAYQAMKDYIAIIKGEYRKRQVSSLDDIMSMRNKMKESKGYKA